MKKLLLCGVATLAVAIASPAKAEGIDLGLGGYFIGYGVYTNQDDVSSLRSFDFRKETELHVNGETTLDNGLTVGAHVELDVDNSDTSASVEESYMYLSGGWGRVNFGNEDGASYLLQVAAPSADDNIDGIRGDISAFDYGEMLGVASVGGVLDYAQDDSQAFTKLTYITPLFNGFQAGASFTPAYDTVDSAGASTTDDDVGEFKNGADLAVRYQGAFQDVDMTVGAGYSVAQAEVDDATNDDLKTWNVGARAGMGAFGLGVSYLNTNNGLDGSADTDIVVVGADYVTGPFKFGASYYNADQETGILVPTTSIEADRYTAGVG